MVSAKEDNTDKKKVSEFIIDETLLKVGENYVWLWIAIEPIDKIDPWYSYFYRKEVYL